MEDVKTNAKEEYLKGTKQKDICTKYNISINTLKSWIKRYKWSEEKRNKGAPINKKGAPINIDKKKEKTSKEAKPKWNKVSYPSMKRLDNKNAIVTGEFESIFFDTLEEDELALIENIELEKKKLLKQQIQLLTVRERRMLIRIAKLKEVEMTIVKQQQGIEKGNETNLLEYEGTLGQIQNIEEALTRVQDKKLKAIDALHKFEVDGHKLELEVMKTELAILKQGGDEGEVEDDGFIEALNSETAEVWNDED